MVCGAKLLPSSIASVHPLAPGEGADESAEGRCGCPFAREFVQLHELVLSGTFGTERRRTTFNALRW